MRGLPALAGLLSLALCASVAHGTVHSLGGNARFQVGTGLPVPITGTPPPVGRIRATPSATVMQTSGPHPMRLSLPPGALSASAEDLTIGINLHGSNFFQVHTAVSVVFPDTQTESGGAAGSVAFSAGRRTGAATETWCPGSGATPPFGCTRPDQGVIHGLLRYTATKSQFGGPARARIGGEADTALRGGDPAPCTYGGGANRLCLASMVRATPHEAGVVGGTFGAATARVQNTPPTGMLFVTVTAVGRIVEATPTPDRLDGLPNPVAAYGGPWTTGMLTISVTQNVGASPEIFIISGSDRRNPAGRGKLSLVAGGLSERALYGPHANRGWLNLEIGPPPGAHVPALPAAAAAVLAALAAGTGGFALRRRGR